MDSFARRAAAQAEELQATAVEIAAGTARWAGLFPPDLYDELPLPQPFLAAVSPTFGPRRPIDRLAAGDHAFGMAIVAGALERSAEPPGLMRELRRVIQPGGLLYLIAPLTVIEPSTDPRAGRARYGLNYLLGAGGFEITDLATIEDSPLYAVVARTRLTDEPRAEQDQKATAS